MGQKNGASPQFAYSLKAFNNRVLYSGPLFDQDELAHAIETLMYGKWFSSGEKVHKFEIQFSKYQVDSGNVSFRESIFLLKYFRYLLMIS